MSSSQTEQAQLLIDTFGMLGDWEDKYRFIIDLGRQMPPMEVTAKVDANKVRGCLSSVWVVAASREENGERIVDFVADSDSAIVKGLVAILRSVYSGQTARGILGFDIDGLFQQLDLAGHLSMGRRNGLAEMVTRLKAMAAEQSAS